MTLRTVEPTDDEAFANWFNVLQAAELLRDNEAATGWQPDEWRARALDEITPIQLLAWTVGDVFVAVAGLHMTTQDNLHTLRCDLYTHPEHRRRGYGRSLLGAVEGFAYERGRRELTCFSIEGAREVGQGPGRAFAKALGYELADDSRRFDIAWPLSHDQRDALVDRWSPFASGYELISWRGSTPDALLDQRSELAAAMSVLSPWANYEPEAERWDATRMRAHETTTAGMGRLLLVSVARDRVTGRLVAFSELTVSEVAPDTAYQWDTLVIPEHRGHRLGGLMKLANLDQLGSTGLEVRRVTTFNSNINEPMIRVNLELGARVHGAAVLWRRDLGPAL